MRCLRTDPRRAERHTQGRSGCVRSRCILAQREPLHAPCRRTASSCPRGRTWTSRKIRLTPNHSSPMANCLHNHPPKAYSRRRTSAGLSRVAPNSAKNRTVTVPCELRDGEQLISLVHLARERQTAQNGTHMRTCAQSRAIENSVNSYQADSTQTHTEAASTQTDPPRE